jgi:DNA adenine methylase
LYQQIQRDPEQLIAQLKEYQRKYHSSTRAEASALYYAERDAWNNGFWSDDEGQCPSRFVFLKQTAFNGLWRVNTKGKLNAAWGKYGFAEDGSVTRMPLICDEENIRAWHTALRGATLLANDMLTLELPVKAGDVVYLDPPYVETFNQYTTDGFSIAQHEMLLDMAAKWSKLGATVVYSNSPEAEPLVRKIWPSATIDWLTTSYTVNRSAEGRAGKRELLAYFSKVPD